MAMLRDRRSFFATRSIARTSSHERGRYRIGVTVSGSGSDVLSGFFFVMSDMLTAPVPVRNQDATFMIAEKNQNAIDFSDFILILSW
jgi:hypothetical protein